MRKIREVLRLKFECGRANRQIASSCHVSAATVSEYLQRARAAAVSWTDAQALTDAELEARLFAQPQYRASLPRAPIDLDWVHQELRRTGVTLQLLWTEYVEAAQSRKGEEQRGMRFEIEAVVDAFPASLGLRRGGGEVRGRRASLPGALELFVGARSTRVPLAARIGEVAASVSAIVTESGDGDESVAKRSRESRRLGGASLLLAEGGSGLERNALRDRSRC